MNESIELQRLREETRLALASMRAELDQARGDLLATNAVLHAVIAADPERAKLRNRIAQVDKQIQANGDGWSPRFRDAYTTAIAVLTESAGSALLP